MRFDELAVITGGLLTIIFVYWFFLGKKEKEVQVKNEVDIIVDGGYSPGVVSVGRGNTTKINFIRKDSNSCLEEVVLPDFKIKKYLPLNEKVIVEITPQHVGEFVYSCGMNMYHGKIIVK